MTDFEDGVFYSVALMVHMHGCTTIACDVLKEAGLFGMDISKLDEFEKSALVRVVNNEPEAYFEGL